MNTKKLTHLYAALVLVMAFAFSSCNTPYLNDLIPEETTMNEVKYVPVFNTCTIAASLSSRSVSYTMPAIGTNPDDPKNVLFQLPMVAPVILSVSANTENYKVGDTFESVILGNVVKTEISLDAEGNVIYTGKWADGKSYYKFTVTADGKAKFEQHINLTMSSDSSDQYFVITDIPDATISSDGRFSGNDGTSKCVRIMSRIVDSVTVTEAVKYFYKFNMGTAKDSAINYVFQATESQDWKPVASTFAEADLDITSNVMISAISSIVPDSNSRTYTDDVFMLIAYCKNSVWNMVSSSTQEETISGEIKSGKALAEAIWSAL